MPEGYIIGEGYVGKKFKELIQPNWIGTHRSAQPGCEVFDWLLRETWGNLKKAEYCLITCPLKEGSDLIFAEFAEYVRNQFENVIILSSTSVFLEFGGTSNPVNEESVLNLNSHQVKREQVLMRNGAVVLNLAGIYGINRSPVSWLLSQKIHPNKLFVNVIHVEDVVKIVDRIFKKKLEKERFIVSDGKAHYWETIINFCKEKNILSPEFKRTGTQDPKNRYITNRKLLKALPSDYEFVNLYTFIENTAII